MNKKITKENLPENNELIKVWNNDNSSKVYYKYFYRFNNIETVNGLNDNRPIGVYAEGYNAFTATNRRFVLLEYYEEGERLTDEEKEEILNISKTLPSYLSK